MSVSTQDCIRDWSGVMLELTFKYVGHHKGFVVRPLSISVVMYKGFALLLTDPWLRGFDMVGASPGCAWRRGPIGQVPDSPEAPSATPSPTPFAPVPEVLGGLWG